MLRYIILITILVIFLIKKFILLSFKTRKSKELYDGILAHRGFHMIYPENTLESYSASIDAKFMGIELDIRYLKDGSIVCFHDRFTKRLLDIPGKISGFTLEDVKRFYVQGSNYKVPTLEETLKLVNGRCILLIEVKGNITKDNLKKLESIVASYPYVDILYFHTKNVRTYKVLKNIYGDKVFYILNPFRKRFNFIKGSDYKIYKNKYEELLQEINIEIPSPQDIGQIIAQHLQNIEDKKEILASIGAVINHYETRIKGESHWVNNSLWLHRGIISDKFLEHSRESFLACIDFAKENNISVTVEFDVMLYKNEVRCYHKDKIPSLFGQEKSCAEKLKLKNSLTLKEILDIFSGNEEYINLAIDIKDYHITNKMLPELIINEIESSDFKGNFILMSYNPLVLNYFRNIRKDYLRAQIGHSLSGLRKVPFFRFPWLLNGVLGILFDIGHADLTLFDNSEWIFWMISYHKNIKGKPVLIYAPKSFIEVEGFIGKESISNFIIENVENKNSWPEEYINKFKKDV